MSFPLKFLHTIQSRIFVKTIVGPFLSVFLKSSDLSVLTDKNDQGLIDDLILSVSLSNDKFVVVYTCMYFTVFDVIRLTIRFTEKRYLFPFNVHYISFFKTSQDKNVGSHGLYCFYKLLTPA